MKVFLSFIAAAATITFSHAVADERAKDVVVFMEEYLRLWNAGDAAAITSKIYHFDAANAFATQEGLQSEFARLKADGYSHSEKISIEACWISTTQALVDMRYTRLKTDGTAMLPKERSTLYFVKKTSDGLRINNLIPMNPTTHWSCSSYLESR
jgi:hypothetical protein